MTIDDFWRKYNRCPLCESYTVQGAACDGCKWYTPIPRADRMFDKFVPTAAAVRLMNKEVDA